MEVWAYVFITTREPKRVLRAVRLMTGVIHADALLGSPDVVAIVSGSNIGDLDAVIDRVAEVPGVTATDSKVARWVDGVGPPGAAKTVVA
jgi:DNA-binding Lrp family transcriptional regulator